MAANLAADASFIGKGKTDGFANRTPLSKRRSADPTDGECQWIVEEECSDDDAAAHAQVPALRPSLCQARSSRAASVGNAWDKEEESRLTRGFTRRPCRSPTPCPSAGVRDKARARWGSASTATDPCPHMLARPPIRSRSCAQV